MSTILTCLFFLGTTILLAQSNQDSWQKVLNAKKGSISATWYTSRPFIESTADGGITGIEYDILMGFQDYLRRKHAIDLEIVWIKNESFLDTYRSVRDSEAPGLLGVSAFSITTERQKEVAFAPPYMADIAVLISSYDIPIVHNTSEFVSVFNNLTAVTIEGTTYARDLMRLKEQYGLHFTIEYIPSSGNILETVASRKATFGFIDLPIYLTAFSRNSTLSLKRQNLFPVKRTGYSIILPRTSDWSSPLEEYFLSKDFQDRRTGIIGKYMDRSLYEFIRSVYEAADEDVILLTKEKEIQNAALKGQVKQIEQEATFRTYLILGVAVVAICLIIILRLYFVRHRTNQLLRSQTARLVELNEEKNHLIRILAHDLRAPINQMSGLAGILLIESERLSPTQKEVASNLRIASNRLSAMISKVLDVDAIENESIKVDIESIDLKPFITEALSRFSPEASKKNISIKYECEAVSPIRADAVYLAQVVDNLLSNAIKFSGTGTTINVGIIRIPEGVELRIKDEGPGFTEDDKARMFGKFQTLSARPTASESSTGLGLSIVRKYVDLMKADLRLESEVGKGSTFVIAFPAAR